MYPKDLPWNWVPSLKTKVTFFISDILFLYFILIRTKVFSTLCSSLIYDKHSLCSSRKTGCKAWFRREWDNGL